MLIFVFVCALIAMACAAGVVYFGFMAADWLGEMYQRWKSRNR